MSDSHPDTPEAAALEMTREGGALRLHFRGEWLIQRSGLPTPALVAEEFRKNTPPTTLRFDLQGVKKYDSALITFLLQCHDLCHTTKTTFDFDSLTEGPRRLLLLATAVPDNTDARPAHVREGFFAHVGDEALVAVDDVKEIFQFLGEVTIATTRFFMGKARFRWSDVWLNMQQCGSDALPIVSLISFLVGLILAYVGAITLKQYGGLIFIANLVGLAMVREMGAMMTGVIMSGRTGAAFAAQLGTMKVSEEIAALRTLGLSPIEFLVLPRMIALFVMFPLLTLYASFIGIVGGLVVALSMDLSYSQYVNQLTSAVNLSNFSVGMIKGFVFGLIVAATGCLRGMQCGNSSAAVGQATTRAVVSGITCMIVADAIFAVIFNVLNM
jgi:phospholipid/cholesterol/gamma-HCH transport system permease protein